MNNKQSSSNYEPGIFWIVLSFIPLLHWIPMMVAGVNARVRIWWIWGIIYLLPVLMIFILVNPTDGGNAGIVKEDTIMENLIFLAFFVAYIASIVHIFNIRKQYKQKRKHLLSGIRQQPAAERPHDALVDEAAQLSKTILNKIKRSRHFDSTILKETRPLVKTYLEQLDELSRRDEQLGQVLSSRKGREMKQTLKNLEEKMKQADDTELKMEYQRTINQYQKQIQTLQEFSNEREKIHLRMKNTLASLRQLKYDLMKMENLSSGQQRREVFNAFDERVKDLSAYLEALDSTYSENQNYV